MMLRDVYRETGGIRGCWEEAASVAESLLPAEPDMRHSMGSRLRERLPAHLTFATNSHEVGSDFERTNAADHVPGSSTDVLSVSGMNGT